MDLACERATLRASADRFKAPSLGYHERVSDRPAEPNDATPFLPSKRSLTALRDAAADCRGCQLWRGATGTVFGEGLVRSRVMLVGEQPGDREDLAGRPFVGPAGRELDKALEAAGIARDEAYLTNVVKHFKFEQRGKRRIHQTPKRFEVDACRPWLDEELRIVAPEALVILGATAAKALLGSSFRVTRHRGELLDSDLARVVTATIHPSAILRAPDDAARSEQREALVADLAVVAGALGG
jgi:uracil-DNA glycosylase